MSLGIVNPGHIVKVKVQFTDLQSAKVRPALVICTEEYVQERQDLIVLPITSNLRAERYGGVVLDPADSSFALTGLPKKSIIQTQKPITVHKSLCVDALGCVSEEIYARAMERLKSHLRFAL